MDRGLAEILQHRAREQAGVEVFRFLGAGGAVETLTYAELDRQARGVAALLQSRGAQGRTVLLAYPSGLAFIAALFGCFYAGSIGVPVPALTAQRAFERVAVIARDAQPVLGLTQSSLAAQLDEAHANVRAVPWIMTDRLEAEAAPAPVVARDGVAIIQYTSGTTSRPRGVMLTHDNLIHNLIAILQDFVRRPDDKAVSWLPMHHDMGLILFVLLPVFCDLPCALMSPLTFLQRPLRWLEAIAAFRGTMSSAPSFAYDLCARRSTPEQRAKIDLSSWRYAACGADAVRPEVLEAFASAFAGSGFESGAFLPAYGLAEATLYVSSRQGLAVEETSSASITRGCLAVDPSAPRDRRLTYCGRPSASHHVAIVDPDTRARRGEGEIGEIWVRGGSVSSGYWNDPKATAEVFRAQIAGEANVGDWLRTGDLGALGPEGLLVTGRRKDTIVIRGANFDPQDLETAAAASVPALAASVGAAFSVETPDGEAVVLAHEVERSAWAKIEFAETVSAIASALSARFGLALYDLVLVRTGALPRTTSGKIQRRLCRERYLSGEWARLSEAPHPALTRWRPRLV